MWHAGPDRRLAIMLDGEDLARHAAVFDAIRRTGGYLFADHARAGRHVYGGMVDCPQGSHLPAGLLNGATAGAIYNHLPVTAPDRLAASVASTPGPVLLLALSDPAGARARAACARHTAARIEVVRV